MNERKFILYMHTNTINGKKYIGITSRTLKERVLSGHGYKNCTAFQRAIEKYGWSSFTSEVLLENLSEDEAKEKEKEYIKKYDTTNSNNGYNISDGGGAVNFIAKKYDGNFEEYKGYTIQDLCRKLKMSYELVRARIRYGHTVDEALEFVPFHNAKSIMYEGNFHEYDGMTILEIVKKLNLNRKVVSHRITSYGWSHDEALELVPHKTKHPNRKPTDRYLYRGEVEKYKGMYIRDICKELGFDYEVVKCRLRYGKKSIDEILNLK